MAGASAASSGVARLAGAALGLGVLAFLAALVHGLFAPQPDPKAAPEVDPDPPMALPTLQHPEIPPVVAGPRGVSAEVAASAGVEAAPWAPGLRLHATELAKDWGARRALIEDLTREDRRSYAIGDLLPHGSVLVGISTSAVQIFVADREIVELRADGRLKSVDDFAGARKAAILTRAPELADAYVEEAHRAVASTAAEDPAEVQAAIDALVAAGEPVLDFLLPAVDSPAPVPAGTYAFPTGYGPTHEVQVQGDVVVGVLEAITGQTFGDVFDPSVSAADKAAVARAWRRWWGVP